MSYIQLFLFFARISASTFGGGMVFLSMAKEALSLRGDITKEKLEDITQFAGIAPGPIAGTVSYLTGHYYKGYLGGAIAVFGMILPPFFTILLVSNLIIRYAELPEVKAFFVGVMCASGALVSRTVFLSAREALYDASAPLKIKFIPLASFIFLVSSIYFFKAPPLAALFLACIVGFIPHIKNSLYSFDGFSGLLFFCGFLGLDKISLVFMRIGLGAFGGGVGAIPLIEYELVTRMGWLTSAQFTEVLALSQSTPGPIVINAATFVGFNLAGIAGAAIATLSVVIAPLFVLEALRLAMKRSPAALAGKIRAAIYPAVCGLFALALLPFMKIITTGILQISIFAICLLLLTKPYIRRGAPFLVILSGLCGIVIYYLKI